MGFFSSWTGFFSHHSLQNKRLFSLISLLNNELLKIFLVFASEPTDGPKKSILTGFRIQNVKMIDLKFQISNSKFKIYEL